MTTNTHALSSPAYSRLDPSLTRRAPAQLARPTKAQTGLEMTLFTVFGASIILCAIALFSLYSPRHREVPNRIAEGLKAGRVNLVIIGTSRSGGDVTTESVTLLSLRPDTRQAAMIALPRDLWVDVGRYGSHRLASAVSIGDSSGYPGEGPGLLSDTVERVIKQPVHAYVRVGTADLRSTIDTLGGIDVEVQHPFYEADHRDRFLAGPLHLNGERAIRYAQSTAVRGPQGARVARERRQQQVIAAVLEKIATAPAEVRARLAASTFGRSASTNLTAAQVEQLAGTMQTADLRRVTIEPLVTDFEVRSLIDPGEAVRPRAGDFGKVQELARNVFAGAQPIAAFH